MYYSRPAVFDYYRKPLNVVWCNLSYGVCANIASIAANTEKPPTKRRVNEVQKQFLIVSEISFTEKVLLVTTSRPD